MENNASFHKSEREKERERFGKNAPAGSREKIL